MIWFRKSVENYCKFAKSVEIFDYELKIYNSSLNREIKVIEIDFVTGK